MPYYFWMITLIRNMNNFMNICTLKRTLSQLAGLAHLRWFIWKIFISLEIIQKYLRQTLGFIWNNAPREKFCFCFSGDVYEHWQNLHLWSRTELYVIILWSFAIFLILLNFLRSKVLSHSATCEATHIPVYY